MNKQERKFEKELIKNLTTCCESIKNEVDGFKWLTHTMKFSDINQTIKVICIFDRQIHLEQAESNGGLTLMSKAILKNLNDLNIKPLKAHKQILFDNEENCNLSHDGNWQQRLNQKYN